MCEIGAEKETASQAVVKPDQQSWSRVIATTGGASSMGCMADSAAITPSAATINRQGHRGRSTGRDFIDFASGPPYKRGFPHGIVLRRRDARVTPRKPPRAPEL